MATSTSPTLVSTITLATLPSEFLNAYRINLSGMNWEVRSCTLRKETGAPQKHAERGDLEQSVWEMRGRHKDRCRGMGFAVAVNEQTVLVPLKWDLPVGATAGGYQIEFVEQNTIRPGEPGHDLAVAGILRRAIKDHLKGLSNSALGFLWQHYGRFCQYALPKPGEEHLFAREFEVQPDRLRDGSWVLQFRITTRTLDGRTIGEHYEAGEVHELAEKIELKRANRQTRKNEPVAISVVWDASTSAQFKVTTHDLMEPEEITTHAKLGRNQQSALAGSTIRCSVYKRDPVKAPASQLRLVLDSAITGEAHGETIIAPEDRYELMNLLRDEVDGADVFGCRLLLETLPVSLDGFASGIMRPPAIMVKGAGPSTNRIGDLTEVTARALKDRGRERDRHIKRHGFLASAPLNPLLAYPRNYDERRVKRVQEDLHDMLASRGIDHQFDITNYGDVESLVDDVKKGGYNTALVILPKGPNGVYDRLKRRLPVPSQCIQESNTLPNHWVEISSKELCSGASAKGYRRLRTKLDNTLGNLLVKAGWLPFRPAEPFFYNTHIGIDVGGVANNTAMVCIGHNFAHPERDMVFLPWQLPIPGSQAEPIPPESLVNGLLDCLGRLRTDMQNAGDPPDLDRMLFLRDGRLLGKGNRWNEADALHKLYSEMRTRGWVSENSLWTAVEVLKTAQDWRILSNVDGEIRNPIVGHYVYPLAGENTALVCSTDEPYLTQGTASPHGIKVVDIVGKSSLDEVVRDFLWGADMAFSKPDIGLSLPWVLHVANAGALQASRLYKVTGIPS